jgi:hypothetical protein
VLRIHSPFDFSNPAAKEAFFRELQALRSMNVYGEQDVDELRRELARLRPLMSSRQRSNAALAAHRPTQKPKVSKGAQHRALSRNASDAERASMLSVCERTIRRYRKNLKGR